MRETTKRPHTLEAYLKVVTKAHSLGFKIVSYQILGLPNESLDSMIQTLAFNARLPVLLGASPFYRTPNSPIARGLDLTETDFVQARLTALAIETEHFQRDDIYTLFVTTRIINFLKGLPVAGSASVEELIHQSWLDPRASIGFAILEGLGQNTPMRLCTKTGMVENARFKTSLLIDVLSCAKQIMCQSSSYIDVGEFAQSTRSRQLRKAPLTEDNEAANMSL